jgi:hypothetical protein
VEEYDDAITYVTQLLAHDASRRKAATTMAFFVTSAVGIIGLLTSGNLGDVLDAIALFLGAKSYGDHLLVEVPRELEYESLLRRLQRDRELLERRCLMAAGVLPALPEDEEDLLMLRNRAAPQLSDGTVDEKNE